MTYDQFIRAVESILKKEVRDNITVHLHTNMKNNGIRRYGIMLAERGINVSPTIYLEEYYQQFQRGVSLEAIVSNILKLYEEVRFERPWKGNPIKDYSAIQRKLVYRMINREKNQELLKQIPSVGYLDLAVVFYVLLETGPFGIASVLVRNEHLRSWNVSKEMVYQAAHRNTEYLLPDEFCTMKAVIEELTGHREYEGRNVMYVFSNRTRSFGASAILYDGRLAKIAERLKENYYVLPSSVHETIIVAESDAPAKDDLDEIIREINETQVDPEEVLSNQAYYYDRKEGKLLL